MINKELVFIVSLLLITPLAMATDCFTIQEATDQVIVIQESNLSDTYKQMLIAETFDNICKPVNVTVDIEEQLSKTNESLNQILNDIRDLETDVHQLKTNFTFPVTANTTAVTALEEKIDEKFSDIRRRYTEKDYVEEFNESLINYVNSQLYYQQQSSEWPWVWIGFIGLIIAVVVLYVKFQLLPQFKIEKTALPSVPTRTHTKEELAAPGPLKVSTKNVVELKKTAALKKAPADITKQLYQKIETGEIQTKKDIDDWFTIIKAESA